MEEKKEALDPEVVDEDEDEGPVWRLTNSILSEKELKFASAVANGATLSDAYRDTYPERAGKGYKVINLYASRLARNPKVRQQIEVIQQAVRLSFIVDAPRAAQKMITLSECASSEKIQFEATKDILNRGGLQPPQRIETLHVGIWGSASSDDIRNLLRQKLEKQEENETSD